LVIENLTENFLTSNGPEIGKQVTILSQEILCQVRKFSDITE